MAVVAAAHLHRRPVGADRDPQVARAGVAQGVGDDLLHQPQQRLGLGRFGQRERGGRVEMHPRRVDGREHGADRRQRIDGGRARLGDRGAGLVEQRPGHRLRPGDVLARGEVAQVRRRLEVEAERGQMMAEAVVEVAGDPQPLGRPGVVGEQLTRGQQLHVALEQRGAAFGFAARDLGQQDGERLEGEPGQRHVERHVDRPAAREQAGERRRLRHGDHERHAQRQHGRPPAPRRRPASRPRRSTGTSRSPPAPPAPARRRAAPTAARRRGPAHIAARNTA